MPAFNESFRYKHSRKYESTNHREYTTSLWGFGKLTNPKTPATVDDLDKRLINLLQEDCRTPLNVLARKLGTSKSTVHYRIRRLETEHLIEGYYARISAAKVRKEYAAVVLTRARPGLGLKKRSATAQQISRIPGVWAVYAVFGEYDYIFLVRADNREQLAEKVNQVTQLPNIERTNSQIVEILAKEDPRILLDGVPLRTASKKRPAL